MIDTLKTFRDITIGEIRTGTYDSALASGTAQTVAGTITLPNVGVTFTANTWTAAKTEQCIFRSVSPEPQFAIAVTVPYAGSTQAVQDEIADRFWQNQLLIEVQAEAVVFYVQTEDRTNDAVQATVLETVEAVEHAIARAAATVTNDRASLTPTIVAELAKRKAHVACETAMLSVLNDRE